MNRCMYRIRYLTPGSQGWQYSDWTADHAEAVAEFGTLAQSGCYCLRIEHDTVLVEYA